MAAPPNSHSSGMGRRKMLVTSAIQFGSLALLILGVIGASRSVQGAHVLLLYDERVFQPFDGADNNVAYRPKPKTANRSPMNSRRR